MATPTSRTAAPRRPEASGEGRSGRGKKPTPTTKAPTKKSAADTIVKKTTAPVTKATKVQKSTKKVPAPKAVATRAAKPALKASTPAPTPPAATPGRSKKVTPSLPRRPASTPVSTRSTRFDARRVRGGQRGEPAGAGQTPTAGAMIDKYQTHTGDTGSTQVQVARISMEMDELSTHLKKHPKDHDSRRGLLIMVGKRRRLLNYLKRQDEPTYQSLIVDLKLRK